MSKSQVLAACAAASLAIVLVVSNMPAQGPTGPAAGQPLGGQPIYLLDVNFVFKNYSKLKAMKEQMQADVQRAETRVKGDKDTIRKLQEDLEGYKPGTEDYKKLEQEIATRIADLNVLIALQRKEFMQQEARDYYTIHQEVMDEVNYFASQNRAAMVFKFDREAVDPQIPDSVVRVLNKQVIWNNQGLDITDFILARLNERLPKPGAPRDARFPVRSGTMK